VVKMAEVFFRHIADMRADLVADIKKWAYSGTLAANYSGAVTTIRINDVESYNSYGSGILRLINAAGQSEEVAYTEVANVSGAIYDFTVDATLTYEYLTGEKAGSRLFLDSKIKTAKTSDYKDLAKLFQNQGRNVMIVINVGDIRYPETGSRNSRRGTISLFCVGKYNKGNIDADLAELADDVVKAMSPADANIRENRMINGVQYDPVFQGQLLEMGHDVYLIELESYDQRLPAATRATRNN